MRSHLGKSMSIQSEITINTEKIPQFYFPDGKPLDTLAKASMNEQINIIFGQSQSLEKQKVVQLVQKILELPGYFAPLLVKKHGNSAKITKKQFLNYWNDSANKIVQKRAFLLLSSDPEKKHLTVDDFKDLMNVIMQYHKGLQFLKSSPEFQDFYSICVINRMFFMANRRNDYKMTFRQFKNSRILQSLYNIQEEPEINLNKDFFCYEDFYVIYIKFWELDSNHRFLLSKQQFSKYGQYTLSRKTVQRIFSQSVKKFQNPQFMTFGDFVWFIFCAQDKTTRQSIQYWFKILDLDNNGIVAGYELEYFYEQQNRRLGEMDNASTDFNYQNMICQMIDLLQPKLSMQFTLQDFLKRSKEVGIFINCLTDLNKMLAHDQRDPYEDRAFKNQHPEWTEWDKFVKPEYRRVESMQENQDEEQQVINWEHDQ